MFKQLENHISPSYHYQRFMIALYVPGAVMDPWDLNSLWTETDKGEG